MSIDADLGHIEDLDTELYPKDPMRNFVDGLFSSQMAKRLSGNESSITILPDHPAYKPTEFLVERPELSQEEFEKIGKAVNGEIREAAANFRTGRRGSLLGIEREATVKLVDSGFVPESEKDKWKYYDDEEKCFAVYPLVQFVHSSMMGGPAYEALPEQQVIETHAKPPKKSRKRTALVLGAAAVLLGAAAYHLYSEWEKNKDSDKDGIPDYLETTKYHTDPLKPDPNLGYVLKHGLKEDHINVVKPLDSDGIQQTEEKNFDDILIKNQNISGVDMLSSVPTLKNYLSMITQDGKVTQDELAGAGNFSTLVGKLYNVIANEQYAKDKLVDTESASSLALQLGFDKVEATAPTAFGIAEYSVAVKDEGLPSNPQSLGLLTKGTQDKVYGKDLVDFKTITFYSADGKNKFITPNVPREVWMTAEMLEKVKNELKIDLTETPKSYLGFSQRIFVDNWALFDAEYGMSYYEKGIKPTDAGAQDLILLQFRYDWQAKDGKYYNRDFPWWDSDKLRELYTDDNALRQALFLKFQIRTNTYDMERGWFISGLEAARISLDQSWKEYQKISELYPDGNIGIYNEDPRVFYKGWLADRFCHGLSNTVGQYVGFDDNTIEYFVSKIPNWNEMEFQGKIDQSYGSDQFLTKNWKYWDLVKFTVGYEWWNPNAAGDMTTTTLITPEVLRMSGFPVTHIVIGPVNSIPAGASYVDWAVGLPPNIAKPLTDNFPNANILFGPGYSFGLYSCGDGLTKDGIKEALIPYDGMHVNLMRKD